MQRAELMAFLGLIFAGIGAALLVLTGNEEIVRSIAESSTCNEQPCTEDEIRTMMTVGGIAGLAVGSPMFLIGLVRALRGDSGSGTSSTSPEGDSSAPRPSSGRWDPTPRVPGPFQTPSGQGSGPTVESGSGYGSPVVVSGDPAAEIDALDAELAAGRLTAEQYQKRREKLLKKL